MIIFLIIRDLIECMNIIFRDDLKNGFLKDCLDGEKEGKDTKFLDDSIKTSYKWVFHTLPKI